MTTRGTTFIVPENGTWADPIPAHDLKLLDADGDTARQFTLTGPSEVVFLGPKGPEGRVVIPLAIGTVDQGRRAATILEAAFKAVGEICAETIDQNACDHEWVSHRFSRNLDSTMVCDRCALTKDPA